MDTDEGGEVRKIQYAVFCLLFVTTGCFLVAADFGVTNPTTTTTEDMGYLVSKDTASSLLADPSKSIARPSGLGWHISPGCYGYTRSADWEVVERMARRVNELELELSRQDSVRHIMEDVEMWKKLKALESRIQALEGMSRLRRLDGMGEK